MSEENKSPEKQAKKEEVKTICFTLGNKAAIWEGRRGDGTTLKLSRFTGQINGKVESTDTYLYHVVENSILVGELIDSKKDLSSKISEKEEILDLTNMAESRQTSRVKARSILKSATVEELEVTIPTYKDAHMIAAMIEFESRGINKSKRRRDNIINRLKDRLTDLSKEDIKGAAAMVSYSEETATSYKVNQPASDNF
jgi:hypothetical protein